MHIRTVHNRLDSLFGKASKHRCVDCDGQAAEWTWTNDGDKYDIANYDPRCISCHRKYDNSYDNLSNIPSNKGETNGRAKLTEKDVFEIRRLLATNLFSQVEIAKMFGVSQVRISYIKTGRNWGWLK